MPGYDAIVVGAGPNGLAAAITLARAGWSVLVREGRDTVGGGTRSLPLTLPGFVHDMCSAFHPLGLGSPFMRSVPLDKFGLEWIHPRFPLAHPFDDGTAGVLAQSLDETCERLGVDGPVYKALMKPLAAQWDELSADVLSPLRFPHHPFLFVRFGLAAMWPARVLAERLFRDPKTRAMFLGVAAHSFLPLEQSLTASFGLVLGALAHAVGWPMARGGSQKIADALAAYLRSLGGEIATGAPVENVDELPSARAVLFDVTPRQLFRIAGQHFPDGYRRRLAGYRYGPGVFKIDLALDGPIPWTAPECTQAGTVHLGSSAEEISRSERDATQGRTAERPFVLVGQQSLFDPTRAPEGQHTVWAYCHVPNGATTDMTECIERQIERFAPGFRERIIARHTTSTVELESYNPNYVGGDINGGLQDWRQLYTRPMLRAVPYSTPDKRIYLCSSSTPPGGGVHGMCGYWAAQAALRDHG
jgi:phytoene dehydrogenase-like protein